jgi:hypothetical protein
LQALRHAHEPGEGDEPRVGAELLDPDEGDERGHRADAHEHDLAGQHAGQGPLHGGKVVALAGDVASTREQEAVADEDPEQDRERLGEEHPPELGGPSARASHGRVMIGRMVVTACTAYMAAAFCVIGCGPC